MADLRTLALHDGQGLSVSAVAQDVSFSQQK
jgi:hypothetical protein